MVDDGRPMEDRIVDALRRIQRANDLRSHRLKAAVLITGPQLTVLRALKRNGPSTASALAASVALSGPTITGIVSRLEARALVTREKSVDDARKVVVRLTDEGQALAERAPSKTEDAFLSRIRALPEENQAILAFALEQVSSLIHVDED